MEKQIRIKQAVILAGGLGTRLSPLTNDRPKPMVLVNGRPFLEYLISLLKDNGIEEVILLLGYLPEKVIEHFGDGSRFGIDIKYSVGTIDDETGTRIVNAKELLDSHFLLMYGDNYWPVNVARMTEYYLGKNAMCMLTSYNNKDGGGEYGPMNNLSVNENGMATHYLTGGYSKESEFNGIDAGAFIIDKKILELAPGHNFSFQKEILTRLAISGQLSAYRIDHPYYYITSPDRLIEVEKFFEPKKVIFMDRDGVINQKMPIHDYVKKVDEFRFIDGVPEAIKKLNDSGYKIFLITNQAGISRGLMSEDDLRLIHEYMCAGLAKAGARVDGIYYCPHRDDEGCECRKPRAGLLYRAAREKYIDLTQAIFIGDSKSDAEAAMGAGCRFEDVNENKGLHEVAKLLL